MIEENPKVRVHPVDVSFPSPSLPTTYADGIANVAPNSSTVKFYLVRTDPDQTGKDEYKNQIIEQVVMPSAAFLQSLAFMVGAAMAFIEQGAFEKDNTDAFKKQISEYARK